MSMINVSLTVGSWYEFVDLDDPNMIQFYLDSNDDVIVALESSEPDSNSSGFACTTGMNQFVIPVGKSCWIKLISGAADVVYSQFGGLALDVTKCAFARTDTIAIDDIVSNTSPIVGFDDSAVNQLTYIGLLHTEPAGLASTVTINAASTTLQFGKFRAGRTIRVFGIEEPASITASLTNYSDLATGYTLTAAFAEIDLDGSGAAFADLTTVVQELVDDTAGWTTASPIQLWISDITGSPTSGLDETALIAVTGRASSLFIRSS